MLVSFKVPAPAFVSIAIAETKPINLFEIYYRAVCEVESGSNPYKVNFDEGSIGILQIRTIKLNDYNRIAKKDIALNELFMPSVSKSIFMFHCSRYDKIEIAIRKWNGKLSLTDGYWAKIQATL